MKVTVRDTDLKALPPPKCPRRHFSPNLLPQRIPDGLPAWSQTAIRRIPILPPVTQHLGTCRFLASFLRGKFILRNCESRLYPGELNSRRFPASIPFGTSLTLVLPCPNWF